MTKRNYAPINIAKDLYRYSTDAPEVYGEATVLGVLGHAVGRKTFHLIQPDAVFHNSYIKLVGPSTVSRKSTAQDLGKKLYDMERWLPNESSPEKLLVNLSEQPEGFIWMGEYSKLLKGINGHGYMATMAENLNDLFTCPPLFVRDTISKGKIVIKNAYLSVHSTITPEVLKENMTSEMFEGGLEARWLNVKGVPKPKPRGRLQENVFNLYADLRRIIDGILQTEKDVYFEFTDKALEYYNKMEDEVIYNEDYNCVGAFAGRYENYVVAFADLYLISDAIDVAIDESKAIKDMKMSEMMKSFADKYEEEGKVSGLGRLEDLVKLVSTNSGKTNKNKANNPTNLPKFLTVPEFKCMVPVEYVQRAYEFVKPCLDFVKELAQYVDMEKPLAKTREYIKKHKKVSRIRLSRNTNIGSDKLSTAIKTLVEDRKEVKLELVPNPAKANTFKRYYVWIGGN